MLRARLSYRQGDLHLDVQLTLPRGFTALFGSSGAGKTTLLNLLAGLRLPDQGEIYLGDETLFSDSTGKHLPPHRRGIGYVFQEARLFPHLTVLDNLHFGWKRLPAGQRPFAPEQIIDLTGIGNLLDRRPISLSGGEKQRVAIARALLAGPRFLLLDEPLSALDVPARIGFLNLLTTIHRTLNLPMLYVSHDIHSVMGWAEQVLLMEKGKIVATGSPREILPRMMRAHPPGEAVVPNLLRATVVSLENGTEVDARGLGLILPGGSGLPGEKILVEIDASNIILATEKPLNLSARNLIAGKIAQIQDGEDQSLVWVNAGPELAVSLLPSTVREMGLQVGQAVFLIIKASAIRCYGNR